MPSLQSQPEGTATREDAGVIVTLTDVGLYEGLMMEIVANAATDIDSHGSLNGSDFSTDELRWVDMSTGAVFASTEITGTGIFYLERTAGLAAVRIDLTGTGEATIRWRAGPSRRP